MNNGAFYTRVISLVAVAVFGLTLGAAATPLCIASSGLICSFDGVADEVEIGGDYLTPEQMDAVAPGSEILIVQAGNNNQASALIVNSPGSVVRQGQFGNDNVSTVVVFGGVQNEVNVLQKGNGFSSDIFLIGSQQTTVTNLQSGSTAHPVKQLFVIHGKPGTKITMK